MEISLIWAQAFDVNGKAGAIGFRGAMPWHLPEDMKNFTRLTTGHPVIMGSNTWDSLPERFRPLPGRHNIVLVPAVGDFVGTGASVATSIEQALDFAKTGDSALLDSTDDVSIDRSQVWIIGGGFVYREFMPFATKAMMTQIDARYTVDTYAPDIEALVDAGEWQVNDSGEWLIPQGDRSKNSEIKRYRFVEYGANAKK
jgi:dihydrofolate reductase